MPIPKTTIARLSRDKRFLIRTSLLLSLCAIFVSFLFSLWSPAKMSAREEIDALKEIIATSDEEITPRGFAGWVSLIRTGIATRNAIYLRDARGIKADPEGYDGDPIEPEGIEGNRAEMLHALDLGLRLRDPSAGIEILNSLPETMRYREEFLGDIEFIRENYLQAASHYRKEAQTHRDATYSARSAIIATWRSGDRAALKEILRNASLRREFNLPEQLDLYTDARDFGGLAFAVFRYEVSELFTLATIPALFTGAVWFLILMPFWQVGRSRLILAFLAVFAGIISAGLTIYVVMIQERMQGFSHDLNAPPLNQVIFFVAGVALREETLKLLCFLPFGIWAARRGRYLEGLVLASLVGLGFAFKENILYFASGLSSFTAWIRFLTANVLHFSLTGIAGYYLVRMIHRKFHGLESFLVAFLGVVLGHGLYNSVIAVPSLMDYSPLSTILVAAMAYQFFDPLRTHMETQGIAQRISPLGVFVLGSALIACGLMVASSLFTPFRFSLGVFASSVAGLVPLAFAYISRFRDL